MCLLFVCLGVNKASQEGALQRHPGIEFSFNIPMYGGASGSVNAPHQRATGIYNIHQCSAMTWAATGVSHFISGGIFTHLAGRGSPKDVLHIST
jgi:hypothetical protein